MTSTIAAMLADAQLLDEFTLFPGQLAGVLEAPASVVARAIEDVSAQLPSGGWPERSEFLAHLTGTARMTAPAPHAENLHAAPCARPGRANPEACLPDFWRSQIITRASAYEAAHNAFGKRPPADLHPVWSFDRFGQTLSYLSDGRWVAVGGEHEDHYDDDFCIYADVTVFGAAGDIQHFIYPSVDFPPTDFHSATVLDGFILMIGALGYPDARRPGVTQVLRLDTSDMSVRSVLTRGECPGWIHGHSAVRKGRDVVISGGRVEPGYSPMKGTWALDVQTMTWRKV